MTGRALLTSLLLSAGLFAADVDPKTLDGKVLFGYQGWFNCPGDGSPRPTWSSWSRGVPTAATLTIDMYPDLSELDADERCEVPGMTIGGKPAYVYSAWNRKTVLRHFRWMEEYGLDGVLFQRFVGRIAERRASGDVVLKNVMAGAKQSGRTFALEYDITGGNPATLAQVLRDDWAYLVDELKITSHPNYLHHNGKPVLSVWGIGLDEPNHPPESPQAAKELIEWFQFKAPAKYQVTYMGGTPSRWATLTRDSRKDETWADVFKTMNVIQPWTVGRYRDTATVDRWKEDILVPDLKLAAQNKQLYMPVIFPGFSWAQPEEDESRESDTAQSRRILMAPGVQRQVAGAKTLKIAMFDEVNEATAMFKLAARRQDAPDQGYWLTLDADGADLPSDWYLRLAGEITRMFHGEIAADPKLPSNPGPARKPAPAR